MATPESDTPTQLETTEKKSEMTNLDESGVVSETLESNQDTDNNLAKEDGVAEAADSVKNANVEGDSSNNNVQENGETCATDNKEPIAAAPQAAPATTAPVPTETNPDETKEESVEATTTPSISPKKQTSAAAKSASFIHDPNKITLRFLFAGRDGTHVIIDCKPNDTVGEVKGALMSVWPEGKCILVFLYRFA